MPSRPSPASADAARIRTLEARIAELEAALVMQTRRVDECARSEMRLAVLAEATHSFADAGADLPALSQTITEFVAGKIGDLCSLRLISPDEALLISAHTAHPDPEGRALAAAIDHLSLRVDEGHTRQVIRDGQPLYIPVVEPASFRPTVPPQFLPYLDRFGIDSLCIVPLSTRGEVIGTLTLARNAGGATYTPADLAMLQDLADRAALALAHAQALSREREARASAEHVAERAALLSVATSILSSGSLDHSTLTRVADLLVPRFGERCLLDLAGSGLAPLRLLVRADGPEQYVSESQPQGGLLFLFAGHPFAEALDASGATILPALTPAQSRLLDAPETATCLCVPLRVRGQVVGLLALAANDPAHGYTPADRILGDEMGMRIGQAIAHAQVTSAWEQTTEARDEAFALLDTIFATVPVGLGVLNAELRYIRVNQALAEVDGLPVAAYPGRTPAELLPGLAPTFEPILRQVLATGVAVRDLDIHGLTEADPGEPRDWQASYYPVRDADRYVIGVGAVVVEVTERVRAQQALQRQADALREQAALLDHAHVLVRELDGRIIFWNQGAERLYGWTAEEAVGQVTHQLFQTRFPASLEVFQHDLLRDGAWEGELAHTRHDGAELLVASHQVVFRDEAGCPLRILEVNNDITALRRAERVLRERDEQLRLAHDAAQLGTWWRNLASAEIHLDERASAHYGLRSGVMPVAVLMERIHSEDRERWGQAVAQTLDPAGDGRAAAEYRVIHPGGDVRWLAIHAQAHFAGEGETRHPVMSSGTSQDITARKREEEALRVSEVNLRTILESASQAFMLLDRELRVLQWNGEAAAMIGAQSEEELCVGTVVTTYLPPARVPERLALMRRALAGERVRVEGAIGLAATPRWAVIEYVPVYDDDGQVVGICASGLDITEQRASQRALEYERQQLVAIVNTMHEGVIAIRPDGTLALINPAALSLRGFDPAAPPINLMDLGRTPHQFLDAHGQPVHQEALPLSRVLCGEQFVGLELHLRSTRDGQDRWLSFNGIPVYDQDGMLILGVVTSQDITQRKRDEAALHQQAAMLDHAHVLIRDAESRIIFWNQGAERLYGWKAAEAIGRVSHDLLQTHFPISKEGVQDELFATGRWEGELTQRRRDGSEVVVASLKVLFRDASGTPTHILEVNNDVTALKRAEQALRERDAQLRLAYDAAELGTWQRDLATGSRLVHLDARAQAHYSAADPHLALDDLLTRIHPDDQPRVARVIDSLADSTGPERTMVDYRLTLPDGTLRWLAVHIRVFFAGAGAARRPLLATGTVQDITARKQAEAQVHAALAAEQAARHTAEQASMRAARLQALTADLAGALSRDAVSEVIIGHGLAAAGAYATVVALVDPERQQLEVLGWSRRSAEDDAPFRVLPLSALAPPAAAVRTGTPIWLASRVEAETHFPDGAQLMVRYDQHAHATLPLLSADRVIGTLSFSYEQPHAFIPEERAFLGSLAQQCAQALERARLYAEVLAAHARLQVLSERLVAVQEEERHHLARELHDEIGQSLTGLSLMLLMGPGLPAEELQARLAEAQRQVSTLIAQVRQRSLDLRPSMLDDMGLHAALSWYLARYSEQSGITLTVQLEGLAARLPPLVELTAYRIVQEALTNVARHAEVAHASVAVWVVAEELLIEVTDPGRGFDVVAAQGAYISSGLAGMRERARLLGGELSIESEPGAGTRLLANLPIAGRREIWEEHQ